MFVPCIGWSVLCQNHDPAISEIIRRSDMTGRVLVVDDEPSIRHMLKQVLLDENYHALAAGSVLEALEKLEETPVDLAIVDLLLPGVNGLSLAEAIRMLDPGTPVILITAYGSTAFEGMAAHPAISHYVHKPFNLDRLLDLVHRCMPEHEA
jgi:DNA-binding NtrC family response regulator